MHNKDSHSQAFNIPKKPVLSLILCSRNDQYMGNSRWRLETALNYLGQIVHELGREEEVEVLVADWGSEVPLRDVLQLSPAAAQIVSFLLIPPELARTEQRDSPFPEVLGLNAAARRVTGQYIGRIDQDTLVGARFLRTFFELHQGMRGLGVPLDSALLFANRRRIPYRFAVQCPSFWIVGWFVHRFNRILTIETTRSPNPFYNGPVGIWLLHRNLWEECGGYDERMIYVNAMEVDMTSRLIRKYLMVDLGTLVNYDFYHLEHYHPWSIRRTSRKRNPEQPNVFHPNSKNWGLAEYPLEVLPYNGKIKAEAVGRVQFELPRFLLLMGLVGAQIARDSPIVSLRAAYSLWTRRVGIAWMTVRGEPLVRWPSVLIKLWAGRTVRLSTRQKNTKWF